MNYHRALKQWNTLGGQQRKRVGLDEAWAMPRRGSEAYHEVQALRDGGREEKQPAPVLRMRRPRMAPRAPEAEEEKQFRKQKVEYEKRLGGRRMSDWFARLVLQADNVSQKRPLGEVL